MKHNHRNSWARLTAAAVLAATTLTAQAQFREGGGGRALDANNRVGSGGINGAGPDRQTGGTVTGNQIVTGNVTGGRHFRDTVGYSDPREFRDLTGGIESDRFVRESNAAPRRGQPTINLYEPTAFYGSALATTPPPNFAPTVGASGGYIATTSPLPLDSRVNFGHMGRFGVDASTRGEVIFSGPDDPEAGPTVFSASPLYGVKRYTAEDVPADLFSPTFGDPATDRAGMTEEAIRQMREELAGVTRQPRQRTQDGDAQDAADAAADAPAEPDGQIIDSGLLAPGASRQGGINNQNLNDPVQQDRLTSGIDTGQSTRQQLLVPPQEQSQQYAELQRRLARRGEATSDLQANQDFNRLRAAQAQKGKPTDAPDDRGERPAPGGERPAPGIVPQDIPPAPQDQDSAPAPDANADEPLKINSLATGVKARGLADLLRSAEELMKEEKYTSAVARYDAATQVAPNNPLIVLGRSHAQLGAGQYRQAEVDIRRAIAEGPEVLLAQYNLKSMIGEDRLAFLVEDLKDIAATVPNEVRPHLLLAYIAYNSGNKQEAAEHLAQAEKAAGADDEALAAMRKHWGLPAAAGSDANK